ncbi:MAG: septum formation initiator family protein [Nitrospirae bacterium]|nr:septum formation initiator family protein [Nitrospirota bacterium]
MRKFTGNISLSKKQKRWMFFAITGIASVYLIISFLFYDIGFIKYLKMRGEYNRINADIKRLQEGNKNIREEVKLLKTDPDYIEAYAREKLGLVKEGEIIYRFEDPDKSNIKNQK